MMATLKDGHVRVSDQQDTYYPPIYWEWIGDTLVVTKVMDTALDVNVGEVVTAIEGQAVAEYFKEIWPAISAGTQGWLEYRSQREALGGPERTKLNVGLGNKSVTLERSLSLDTYYPLIALNDTKVKAYDNGILYINLELTSIEELDSMMSSLVQADGLIFDMRGYPDENDELINHLMSIPDTASGWLQIPQTIYPDREGLITYEEDDWTEDMLPEQPYLGDKPIVFLTDGRAISYAESYMGYVKGYGLATVMGQPTAGADGGTNTITLPGGYEIRFTGMRALKHDGGQLQALGFAPDIYLERSVTAVQEGRDEYIEAALTYLKTH